MRTARSAVALGDGSFIIDEVLLADPMEDEVIVQIKAAGLCHTDYDSLSWGKPIVMGHEGAGIVSQIGSSVTAVKPGDVVILNWATPCLRCDQCLRGNHHICDVNSPVVAGSNGYALGHAHFEGSMWQGKPILRSFNLGTMTEFALVKQSALVRIRDDEVSFPAASIVSCGVMTGYGSVVNAAQVSAGSSVVVLGCGGVGLNVIKAAAISGAATIIAVDINAQKLDWARQFGATHCIMAYKSDEGLNNVAVQVKNMLGGTGADYAFECTAIPALGAAPLAMIRNAGTAVQVSGIEEEITIDMRLFEWDKIYINPLYGQATPHIDFPKIWQLYRQGDLPLDDMITSQYTLDNLQVAFDDLLNGRNAKSVIVFDS